MIYHITTRIGWEKAVVEGSYAAESLGTEGFIHTSYEKQVEGVLNRYYQGHSGLVLLHIEEKAVTSEIKYELAPSVNEIFPHIYGRLNLNAVVQVSDI
ncbi:DUF952 domain-containing protein [soil metagenome]